MRSSKSFSGVPAMWVSLPCSLLALMLLDRTSGFQGHLHYNRKPSVVGSSIPLLTNMNSVSASTVTSRTALFDGSLIGLEGDPLEDDRRGKNVEARRRLIPHPGSSVEDQQQQQPQQRLVRPQASSPSSEPGNERKATTTTTAGVNMELRDPKERKLVRHATASSAYGVDAFKGKKKKIIRPWSSGRKRHKKNQNNTGGIAREAYGEELKVELKNAPKKKRLVMARTNSSGGNQDAAKALISGGSKARLTAEDIAEEKRIRNRPIDYDEKDEEYDEYDEDYPDELGDDEPSLVRPSSSIVREPEDDLSDGPNLVRLETSIVRPPEDEKKEEPNLVRLSSSIVREPEDDRIEEPNLVRLESSMVREPEKDAEEELKFYTRSDTSEEEEEEQRLVRAVPASQPPPSDEPKLVRPNIVKEEVEGPKLMRPNFVKAKPDGPKLVRPNVLRAKPKGPKLVRPTNIPDGTQALDFMYGANKSTSNPTSVPLKVKSRRSAKPAFTTGERSANIETTGTENSLDFMYGSTRSSVSPTSVSINSKPKQQASDPIAMDNSPMENLMYGATQAATSPTAVSVENSKLKENVRMPVSTDDNPMDNLMYGAFQATSSPTSVSYDLKSKKKVSRAAENSFEGSGSDVSAMDDLMYGYERASSSPTAVEIKTNPTKYVKPETGGSSSSTEEDTSATSATIYPDGDKRKKVDQRRLKRYVKPSTSAMDQATDWDAANPTSTTTNPTSVNLSNPGSNKSNTVSHSIYGSGDREKKATNEEDGKKKYVQPSASLMDSAPDWDAVQPAMTTSNPSAVNFVGSKSKKAVEYASEGKEKSDTETNEPKKKYVQPSASLMDNAPDWDAVQPATTTSNPSVVNVMGSKSKKAVEYTSGEKEKGDTETKEPTKKYVQPSASLMDNVPDWDAVQPATTTSNPSVVNVDVPKSKKAVEYKGEEKKDASETEGQKKKYVQPSTSLMDNAPDWNIVQPATTTSNPSVLNVDVPKSKKSVEYKGEEKKDVVVEEKTGKRRYYQPSTSLMDNAPDWDAASPAVTTSNPTQVSVNIPQQKKAVIDGKNYVRPSTSCMDSAPDWDAVLPAVATSNPSVVNVDGINNTGKEKRYVRPQSSSTEGSTSSTTRTAPADTPFEYKQVQSIPKENPAGAKPIGDEDTKTKLPAEIAHAAGSSSDGWTPEAHFPSDEKSSSPEEKKSKPGVSRKRTPQKSAMENYDQETLPRPTGVIPLRVSSSVKDKTQLFRPEHSLDPVEDEPSGTSVTPDTVNARSTLEEKTVSPFTRNVSVKKNADATGQVDDDSKDDDSIDVESKDI